MTVFVIPDVTKTADIVTVDQELILDTEGMLDEHGRLVFSFPALCPGHGGVPAEYKSGSRYPHDALLTGETLVICGECGHVRVIRVNG